MISVRGLSSLDVWLRGSIGIFATSLGFARCFHKPFRSLEAIQQLRDHLAAKEKKEKHFCSPWKNRNILAAHFEAWKSFCSHLEVLENHLATKWEFRSPFLKLGAFSHLKKISHFGFQGAKFSHLGKDFSHFGFQGAKFPLSFVQSVFKRP